MINLFLSALIMALTLTACSPGTATRQNDFTPLTSMQITVTPASIAKDTTAKLTVIGNFSGLFHRDITDEVTWSSSAPAVADFTIPAVKSRVSGISPGVTTITATKVTTNNKTVSATVDLTVTNATLQTLTVSPQTPSVPKGLTKQFTVNGHFSDSTDQDLTFDATWSSSDPAKATISNVYPNNGLASAIAVGPTTITASFGAAPPASTLMNVSAAALQTITLTPGTPSILTLASKSFAATGHYSDSSTADITHIVTWDSTQKTVATVTDGIAKGLTEGTSNITASMDGKTGSTALHVTGGNLVSIAVTPATLPLVSGTVARIRAIGTFSNTTTRDITDKVTWAANDGTIATVAATGGNLAWVNATAAAVGTTKVTATYGVVNSSSDITVRTTGLNTLAITPLNMDLSVGASRRLTTQGAFADGSSQDMTFSASWASSPSANATVGDLGVTKGKATGVAATNGSPVTITASFNGVPATTPSTVTVTSVNRTVNGLVISTIPGAFTKGIEVKLTATATFADGSTQDVTEDANWAIDNSNVAVLTDPVNLPGTIDAVNSGTATITVTFLGKTQTLNIAVP